MLKRIHPSVRLALIYLIFSVLWILLSDRVVNRIANNQIELIDQLQNVKGIFFVFVSAILLFFVSRSIYKDLNASIAKKQELINKLNGLNEAAKEGIIDYDLVTDTAIINDQMKGILGAEDSVLPNFAALHLAQIHPEDRERIVQHFNNFMQSETNLWQADYRYKSSNGNYLDIMSRGFLIRDPKTGKPQHALYTLLDVTEERNTKAKYYQQQIQFKQSLTRKMIETQEKERNRWAEELHDNVCQELTVAKLYLEQAVIDEDNMALLKKAQTMVEKALNDIRQISATIKPPEFEYTSLYHAIEGLVANINRFGNLQINLQIDDKTEQFLTEEQKLMVYRVAQEQFNNILKYAEASRVWLNVTLKEDKVFILIKDNGKGFDPKAVQAGIGLKNIRSRLQAFSGSLLIHSAPGQGCELKADFNLN